MTDATNQLHLRAVALLRALTIDLGDGPHDLVDEMNGLDVIQGAALDLLAEMGLGPVPSELLPDPDEEPLTDVYEAALRQAQNDIAA